MTYTIYLHKTSDTLYISTSCAIHIIHLSNTSDTYASLHQLELKAVQVSPLRTRPCAALWVACWSFTAAAHLTPTTSLSLGVHMLFSVTHFPAPASLCSGLHSKVTSLQLWRWACSLSSSWWLFPGFIHVSKFITFSTLNSCSLLYFNCYSIKLFLKNHFLRDFSLIMYERVLAPPRQTPSLIQFCFASLLTSFSTWHGGVYLLLISLLPILLRAGPCLQGQEPRLVPESTEKPGHTVGWLWLGPASLHNLLLISTDSAALWPCSGRKERMSAGTAQSLEHTQCEMPVATKNAQSFYSQVSHCSEMNKDFLPWPPGLLIT